MLSSKKFIHHSLELHLFFARIMKEHSFFLEAGFTPKNSNYIHQADTFRMEFDKLLSDVIHLSTGIISSKTLLIGEAITPYTLDAEEASAYYTGVNIATQLTKAESQLMDHSSVRDNHDKYGALEEKVYDINARAMKLTRNLIQFKTRLLSDVLLCKVFTVNYPLLIDHITREAKLYFRLVRRLQDREETDIEREAYEQEVFWNRIMAEHSKFIRGLLDPSEDELFDTANNFGRKFDKLTKEAKEAMNESSISEVTDDSYNATVAIRKFKEQGTQGLLGCKIKSIILPLLGDHTLREANHYLHLLRKFKKSSDEYYEED